MAQDDTESAEVLSEAAGAVATEPRPRQSPEATADDDIDELLEAANDSARTVTTLHVTFLAFCAYLAVIVWGTSHEDLLRITPVKLPILDVELPITSFFGGVPWLLVVMHFNLLLQFQLLARKLWTLDWALSGYPKADFVRNRLFISPFAHMIAGRQDSWLVHSLLSLVVNLTMILIPQLLLVQTQIAFLPFHDLTITEYQQQAVTIDALLLVLLWPLIASPTGRARDWWIGSGKTQGRVLFGLALTIAISSSFIAAANIYHFSLILNEARLVPKGTPPELFYRLISDDAATRANAFKAFEGLKLRDRNLRGAILSSAALPKADLMGAQLQGAWLLRALLPGAWLENAQLQGAVLISAKLQGTWLAGAHLQGAKLGSAELQGAVLWSAELQGAALERAELQGATLVMTWLQGASLEEAQLQGASLTSAELHGASLINSDLNGALIDEAKMAGAAMNDISIDFAYVRQPDLTTLSAREAEDIVAALKPLKPWVSEDNLSAIRARLERAVKQPAPEIKVKSNRDCWSDWPELGCPYSREDQLPEYRSKLHPYLLKLACESADVAQGIVRRARTYHNNQNYPDYGLAGFLVNLLEKSNENDCPGLAALPDDFKHELREAAKRQAEASATQPPRP